MRVGLIGVVRRREDGRGVGLDDRLIAAGVPDLERAVQGRDPLEVAIADVELVGDQGVRMSVAERS